MLKVNHFMICQHFFFYFSAAKNSLKDSQSRTFLNMAYSYSQMNTDEALEKCEDYYQKALQAAKESSMSSRYYKFLSVWILTLPDQRKSDTRRRERF